MRKHPEVIKTPRLVLRLWHATDVPLLHAVIEANLAHLGPWFPWATKENASSSETAKRVERFERVFKSDSEWQYAIFSPNESALFGGAGVYRETQPRSFAIDFWLQQNAMGKGYATEAVRALVDSCFAQGDVDRVRISCDRRNAPAIAVARRLGFTEVAAAEKQAATPGGTASDTAVWERTGPSSGKQQSHGTHKGGGVRTRGGRATRWVLVAGTLLLLAVGALAAYTHLEVRRAEHQFPAVGKFVTVDGVRLRYTDKGAGPPVVLLHGNPGFVEDFSRVADALARDRRVIVFDRPGHGYSSRLSAEGTTAKDQAQLIRGALAHLRVTGATFVGHSWGGGLALLYALEYPAEVRGLVLVGTRAFPSNASDPLYALNRMPVAGSLFRHTVLLPVGRRVLDTRLARAYAPDSMRAAHWRAARALWLRPTQVDATVWDTWNLDRELRAASSRYREIQIPVTIIAGEHDTMLPESRRLAAAVRRPNLVVVQNTGHQPHITQPTIVVDAVRRAR